MSHSELGIREFDTFDEAQTAAAKEAQATTSLPVPGVLYRQSERYMISTSLPMGFLVNLVRPDSLKKGEDPSDKRNRPLMTDHVRSIREYLASAENYILPPITLNVGSGLT